MITDEQYMRRALTLAENGRGKVSPNPMVGCVIVHEDTIIGEGWHQACGQAHAEVNAVNSVKDQSVLKSSTVYVNLEPCAHYGKTPPCAELLAKHKVKKVVIANMDPNPQVAGRGIQMLNNAGVKVQTDILNEEAQELNQRFFTYHKKKRPWVILKWAETADGYLAKKNYDSKWISNKLSRTLVHKWRAEEDAILVGRNTAHYDNPLLNVRMWEGKNPIRIVMDSQLRLSNELNIFDEQQPTLIINTKMAEVLSNLEYIKVEHKNNLNSILKKLQERNIQSLLVEGGAKLLNEFIDQGIWDEARVFKCPKSFGDGIAAPRLVNAELKHRENVGEDQLMIFKNIEHG